MINDTFTSTAPRMEVLITGWEEVLDKTTGTMGKIWVRRELLQKGKRGLAAIITSATGCPLTP